MAYTSLSGLFKDIAGAIREKEGSSDTIVAADFPERIKGLSGSQTYVPTFQEDIITSTLYPSKAIYADNKFIIIGYELNDTFSKIATNKYLYSTNGITWNEGTFISSVRAIWTDIYYANGTFIVAGLKDNGDSVIIYKSPSNNWRIASDFTNPRQSSHGITYGNGKFVISYSEKILYSSDGNSWSTVDVPGLNPYGIDITYGNGKFVIICARNGFISSDGINWTPVGIPDPGIYENWASICYGNGRFVAVSEHFDIYADDNKDLRAHAAYSLDGINWTMVYLPKNNRFQNASQFKTLCYACGLFVSIDYICGHIIYSSDGTSWKLKTEYGFCDRWCASCYGKGNFLMIGPNRQNDTHEIRILYGNIPKEPEIMRSGIVPSGTALQSVCYGNGRFVAVSSEHGSLGALSLDGINWTSLSLPKTMNWRSICYGTPKTSSSKYYIAVGYDIEPTDQYLYYVNNINNNSWGWKIGTFPISGKWNSICYGKGLFYVVGVDKNVALVSSDGIRWSTTNIPRSDGNSGYMSVCYGNGRFVAVPNSGTMVAYTDIIGDSWKITELSSYITPRLITYANGKFVIIGMDKEGAYSEDGINWFITNLPGCGYTYWYSICHGNDKFIIAGHNYLDYDEESDTFIAEPIMAYSYDGITWNEMIVINKEENDIYYGIPYASMAYDNINNTIVCVGNWEGSRFDYPAYIKP